MKTRFTTEEFDLFTIEIINKGYRKCNGKLHNEDYYFYKSIFKTDYDEYGDRRSVCQLFLSVYDWRKYILHDVKEDFSFTFNIEISRNSNERNSFILDSKLFITIEDAEKTALDLYHYFDTKLSLMTNEEE